MAVTVPLKTLKKQVSASPREPGCYIMRDINSNIIYVGKAKILRTRLNSYFNGTKDIKTATLMRHVHSIETIIVSNEYEALLLENTLIKQHKPKYNIDLKDGKSYPVIRVTNDNFPGIFKTRRIIEDGSRYYGPFPNAQAVEQLLGVLKKIYPIRKCKLLRARTYPCMYYHIGQCLAPCLGNINEAEYAAPLKKIETMLQGETTPLIIELTEMMHNAASKLSFEKAAQFRNAICAINELSSANAVVDFDAEGRDYIAFAAEGVLASWSVFSMRGGKLTGRDLYRTKNAANDKDALETFCLIYYSTARPPPARIFIQKNEDDFKSGALVKYFNEQFGFVPKIEIPNEKRHIAALAMARQNAEEDIRKRIKERGAGPALDEMQKLLNLKQRPVRIEGFDIAQLDGKHPVASLISFYNGIPDKKNYRLFKLKTVIGKVDDFAAVREAVTRRYTRLLREQKELPNLVLIDGGIGQVNAAKSVLDGLGIKIDIAGLAKREEEIWLPAEEETGSSPLKLSRNSEALKILQMVRDETHRMATGLNQKLRSKELYLRSLESIDGISVKRAQKLIKTFKNINAIAGAEPEAIASAAGISLKLAKMVRAAVRIEIENRAEAKAIL